VISFIILWAAFVGRIEPPSNYSPAGTLYPPARGRKLRTARM
jgi:hypothetical protein